jgi:hypothetical protein
MQKEEGADLVASKQTGQRTQRDRGFCVCGILECHSGHERINVRVLTHLTLFRRALLCVDEGAGVAGRCSRGRADVDGVRRVCFRECVSAKRAFVFRLQQPSVNKKKSWMNNQTHSSCVRACFTTPRCSCHTRWCGRCDAALTLVCETLFARLLSCGSRWFVEGTHALLRRCWLCDPSTLHFFHTCASFVCDQCVSSGQPCEISPKQLANRWRCCV